MITGYYTGNNVVRKLKSKLKTRKKNQICHGMAHDADYDAGDADEARLRQTKLSKIEVL